MSKSSAALKCDRLPSVQGRRRLESTRVACSYGTALSLHVSMRCSGMRLYIGALVIARRLWASLLRPGRRSQALVIAHGADGRLVGRNPAALI